VNPDDLRLLALFLVNAGIAETLVSGSDPLTAVRLRVALRTFFVAFGLVCMQVYTVKILGPVAFMVFAFLIVTAIITPEE
jgi:hypothetical protein